MQNLLFGSFVKKYLSDLQKDENFEAYLHVSMFLVQKYGKMIFSPLYAGIVKDKHKTLWDFICFLREHNFWSKYHIKTLVKELEKNNSKKEFSLCIPQDKIEVAKKIENMLVKDFDESKIMYNDNSLLGIQIKWGGYHYKRTLDWDLDVLLK